MPAGEAFSKRQLGLLEHAVRTAQAETGLRFAVYVGRAGDDVRGYARRLHASLGADAELGVLVLVEPEARRLEIVSGRAARHRLDDRAAALAGLSMATSFAGGDLAGGIVSGMRMLAQAAARPRVLHEHEAD